MIFFRFCAALAGACLAALPAAAPAQEALPFIATRLSHSERLFDRQDGVTGKVAATLRARQAGELEVNRLYLGGRALGTVIHEDTNTAGKFPILSRLPPSHTPGTSDTYDVINEVSLAATLTLPMVTAVVQGEYTEIAFPGQKDTQLRKAWVALGDLSRSPFYLAAGRKTVNFGNFDTYAPFTHSHSAHYFWAQTDDPLIELGYVTDRTEAAVSLIRNHRGLRVLSSPMNDGKWENFALNAAHRFEAGDGLQLRLGAGYLHGTIYDSRIAHHPPHTGSNRSWNGAWNVNAVLSGPAFDLMAEYTQTEDAWPATGHKVSAMTLQGRYRSMLFNRPATYSLSASRGVQGASGTEWEKMDQIILGLEVEAAKHVTLGVEYLFNDGFVPLIMPTVVADAGVRSHTVIVGAKLTF
ncbi:hypothetical protein ACUXV3_17360 [Roseobacteraceae bacterium NS-SX3]